MGKKADFVVAGLHVGPDVEIRVMCIPFKCNVLRAFSVFASEECKQSVASFPRHSHRHCLIACSMQIWWGIWSHVMTLGSYIDRG